MPSGDITISRGIQIILRMVRYIIGYYLYFVKYHQVGKEFLKVLVNSIIYIKTKATYAHNLGMQ